MVNAMAYNPRTHDPISVAAFIARYYRLNEGMQGVALRELYNEVVDIAEGVLAGREGEYISIQKAIDLVEIARLKTKKAKYIPQWQPKSITARSAAEFHAPCAQRMMNR